MTSKNAIERTYTDTCNVYEFQKEKEASITKEVKKLVYKNLKCALSQKSLNTTVQNNINNTIAYDAKLFISPDIDIKPGSYIEVTRLESCYEFICSGEGFKYITHQEVLLKRKDKA